MIRTLWVPGRPKPKERPRMSRGRAFTPRATHEAEETIAKAWRAEFGDDQFDGNVYMEVDYSPEGQWIRLVSTPSKSPLTGDIDNYLKTTMDGLQRAEAFKNDRCVVRAVVTKFDGDYDAVREALSRQ